MVYKTSDPDQVVGKFNSTIAGKLLLYLEEMLKKSNLKWTKDVLLNCFCKKSNFGM